MSPVIFKYEVPLDGATHEIALSPGATIVGVEAQADGLATRLYFWAIVGREGVEDRRFRWVGTGEPFEEGLAHRGTVHVRGYVWHLLEERRAWQRRS